MLNLILSDCMYIVLGRFQPFHKGHEHLINQALDLGPTVIAVGSSQAEMSMDNPWNADEREAMIRGWLGDREAKQASDWMNFPSRAPCMMASKTLTVSLSMPRLEDSGWPRKS